MLRSGKRRLSEAIFEPISDPLEGQMYSKCSKQQLNRRSPVLSEAFFYDFGAIVGPCLDLGEAFCQLSAAPILSWILDPLLGEKMRGSAAEGQRKGGKASPPKGEGSSKALLCF